MVCAFRASCCPYGLSLRWLSVWQKKGGNICSVSSENRKLKARGWASLWLERAAAARLYSTPPLFLLPSPQMLVRHCVDCNLDRMTPISQQPRHKIEEIARACTRQFPEFSEQLCRSRIRSYLKSSRRNGKKHGGVICEKKRSLPSTLTSPAAERLFEQALKLELENQERIAKGLEPIQVRFFLLLLSSHCKMIFKKKREKVLCEMSFLPIHSYLFYSLL